MSCSSCRSSQVDVEIPDEVLLDYYDDSYFPGTVFDLVRADKLAVHYVEKLRRHVPKVAEASRALDLGTGYGFFTERIRDWVPELTVDAVEPGRVCRDFILESFPSTRLVGFTLDDVDPANRYEIVFAFHLIEHFARSTNLLRDLRKVLTSGGHLVLITPNAESKGFVKYGARWLWARPDQHLQFLSTRIPQDFFEAIGFEVVSIDQITPAWIAFPATWQIAVQDSLDRLTPRIEVPGRRRRILRLVRRMLIRFDRALDPHPPDLRGVRLERLMKWLFGRPPRDELLVVLRRK